MKMTENKPKCRVCGRTYAICRIKTDLKIIEKKGKKTGLSIFAEGRFSNIYLLAPKSLYI